MRVAVQARIGEEHVERAGQRMARVPPRVSQRGCGARSDRLRERDDGGRGRERRHEARVDRRARVGEHAHRHRPRHKERLQRAEEAALRECARGVGRVGRHVGRAAAVLGAEIDDRRQRVARGGVARRARRERVVQLA